MFLNVQNTFKYACRSGLLDKSNPYIAGMNPVRAYRSPIVDYESYLSKLLIRMNTEIIKNNYNINNITRFEHYVNIFIHYTQNNPQNVNNSKIK